MLSVLQQGFAMANDKVKRAAVFVDILRNLDVTVNGNTRVLDLGCGAGLMVKAGRDKGFRFFGCGYQLYDAHEPAAQELIELGVLRQITDNPYRLPFEEGFFDVVISDQVFEHVMDYPATLREMHRVLKPGGVFLHIFPSKYKVIEPHVNVPFAAVMRARWWMKAWAAFGIRNQFQRKLNARQATEDSLRYLDTRTNYMSKRQLRWHFRQHFTDVRFVERAFLKTSERGRKLYKLSKWLPFLPSLYSMFGSRVAFGRREALPGYAGVERRTQPRPEPVESWIPEQTAARTYRTASHRSA
jgi:SAM-dependent methyltransferase